MELMQANRQWASRPADERFTSLDDMFYFAAGLRDASRQLTYSSRKIELRPLEDESHKDLAIYGQADTPYCPTHWAFGQLAKISGGLSARDLRKLPAEIVCDAVNWCLKFHRSAEDVGLLLTKTEPGTCRAVTGPNYGRIWNADIIAGLQHHLDPNAWSIPGEFGKKVPITKDNTTLYMGDRDMFVFLADEENRIEVPGRRAGMHGNFARGFFCWNSEVGSETIGMGTFLYDYVCCNRIIWGASNYQEVRMRHTSAAPDRWIEEVQPALIAYSKGSTKPIQDAIKEAQKTRLKNEAGEFLAKRFGKGRATAIIAAHNLEEQRPIETVWDVVVGATAYAKGITWQDERTAVERLAGELVKLQGVADHRALALIEV